MKHYHILFVCLGNICRSPMAECVLRHLASEAGVGQRIIVESAGTSGWHDGENMHAGTRKILTKHGISHLGFTSSKVKSSDIEHFDFIIAMDDSNLNDLERLFGKHPDKLFKLTDLIPESGYSSVPDPWYTGDFAETFRLVEAGSSALLKKLELV
ncbi:low molecular weight protein-tyrosine-phosphatase [Neisseria animalis]|uniref:protein-tyrosine-phosphatase n=1 Tax=Neisseria animalis TaxID=492 RepID=A0A5P3MW34_NEIAN|nr:low molecular weight protein-tyrosine-phosphatase [Neisseria animalis]QEY24869.1 low molecular weight phosphotyrosine protein phosphatase [Neisseria animalis]ROW32399.1 low molecular weight phosphotyrosine protein phosphatase [Neisseria animalis]VEE08049.1 Low molecular weight protein tyrosine-phosphatase [Neisseria animalis]